MMQYSSFKHSQGQGLGRVVSSSAFAENCGVLALVFGAGMLVAWLVPWPAVLQVRSDWAPVQPNAAVAFLFSGLALLLLDRVRWWYPVLLTLPATVLAGAALAADAGVGPGLEHILLQARITMEHGSPGRMAPNTALSFLLFSAGMVLLATPLAWKQRAAVSATLASIFLSIALAALFGYALRLEQAYAWLGLGQMALMSAVTMLFLGAGLLSAAFRRHEAELLRPPHWLPQLAALWTGVVALCLWQAVAGLQAHQAPLAGTSRALPYLVLASGLLLAGLLGLAVHVQQLAAERARVADGLNLQLQREAAERERVTHALEEREHLLEVLLKRQQTASDKLERSNEELEAFAYVASHDLQEPLRMVSSYLQLIERRYQDKLDDPGREFIAYAVDGAKRMQRLINDLLLYSRVQTKGREFGEVDSGRVMAATLKNLEVAIAEKDATITLDTLPVVWADEMQLGQLFQNLLSNALKFQDGEHPRISVSTEPLDKYVHFKVRDNGIGIDPQFQERIFQIFQRLHPRGTHEGTGIGLAICKRIVERHGGTIWVESRAGAGAAFHFTLPNTHEGGTV